MNILTKQEATTKILSVLPLDIKILSQLFSDNGFKLFLVGGCVRDAFLNKNPKDFDVCTDASPEQIVSILKAGNITFQLQGEHFGVVVARMSEDIEIATFRTDISQDTGSNKDTIVKFGATIEEDVLRRDLTINALFLDLQTETIIDLVGGEQDLINGIIRAVGNPVERFAEDNLRKLRVVRFASRLGFKIHGDTLNAIMSNPSLNVSGERTVNELTNAFKGAQSPKLLMQILIDTKLLTQIFDGLLFTNNTFVITKRLENCITLNTFLSSFLPFNDKLASKLVAMKFSSDTANSVQFLTALDLLLQHNESIDPTWFKTKIKSTDLTLDEMTTFFDSDINLITWLFNFKHEDGLSEKLMEQGITGKELGLKLKAIAFYRMLKETFEE